MKRCTIPLFLINQEGNLRVFTIANSLTPEKGQVLISMVLESENQTPAG